MEEARIRRAIREIEIKLYNARTLISHGDYDKVGDAMELEATLCALENNLILLIERDYDMIAPPPLPDE